MNHMRRASRLAVFLLLAILLSTCGGVEPVPAPLPTIETATAEPSPPDNVDPGQGCWSEEDVDSDQDGLCDGTELEKTLTDPNSIDTDEDRLTDGKEVFQFKTSPLLADTDGDGMTDFQEIRSGGTSPLLADMPQLSIELFGNPSIDVYHLVKSVKTAETFELAENKELKEKSESEKTNLSIENTIKLHTEAEVGTSQWPPSASAKLTTDSTFSQGYFQNTSSNWEKSSMESIRTESKTVLSDETLFSEGTLSTAFKVTNLSAMSIRLKNLVVNVYQPDQTFIGSLKPSPDTWPEGGGLLGAGGSMTIALTNEKIPAEKIETILQNPTPLIFEVASYEMFKVDEAGADTVNFGVLSQSVIRQSSMISIDYGDGTLERYLVATNIERNPDGSAKGIPLAQALSNIIGLEYRTCDQMQNNIPTGVKVLCELENREQFDNRNDDDDNKGYGYWVVAGTGTQFGTGSMKNFDEILLKPKQSVSLVYFRDSDGDQIFDLQEYLFGTDKDLADTDGDGLTDYQEAKAGWIVRVTDKGKPPYLAYPDPLFSNSDTDGWNDNIEFEYRTNPQMADTDADHVDDDQDVNPLGTCLAEKQKLGLIAWWQPEFDEFNKSYFAKDTWSFDAPVQNGVLVGYDPTKEGADMVFTKEGIPYFSLNRGINANNQYINVNNNEVLSLTGKKDFTYVADIIWDGEVASGEDRATVVAKGSTFALYITKQGAIMFTLYRHVYEECWSGCPDKPLNVMERQTTQNGLISSGKKHHIVAAFIDDMMRIYVDGKQQMNYWTPNKHKTSIYTYQRNFLWLITNQDPFVIGVTLEGTTTKWPFKGRITNIQFFNAKMIPDNVDKLYKYGLCAPAP